jgi:hypothetical protein
VYYTPTKRRYDGGMLVLGHSLTLHGVELVLPPGMKDVVMENFCPGDCTQAVIYVNRSILCVASIPCICIGTSTQWSHCICFISSYTHRW